MRSLACFTGFVASVALVLAVPRAAEARETQAVDEDGDATTIEEEEALGPRGNLRTRAETVSFDARQRVLELSGNVRVDAPPFHLRAQRIKLTRTRFGIEVDGKGRLAFCPCLGTPLTVEFVQAIVAPPGDLILKQPTLELYGVPVMHLPWFWMRGDEKLGVLPPDVSYRGRDGFFVGGGVHVPWKHGTERHALDLRAGGYVIGGFATEARLRTPASITKIRFDRLRGDDGLLADARGATRSDELGTSWDVDVLRGRRGVVATTDLDAAAKPWDRASIEGALRGGPFIVSQGVRAVTRRGGGIPDVDSVGPVTTARTSGALGSHVTFDATLEGGALRVSGAAASAAASASPSIVPDTLSFVRAEVGVAAAANVGALATSLSVRGAGDVAVEGRRDGSDRAGAARVHAGVPLARSFRAEGDENDPWIHVIEPFVELGGLHARGDNLLGTSPGRALAVIDGTTAVPSVGISSSLGRWARRESLDLLVAAGGALGSRQTTSGVQPLVRARLSASLEWLGATAEAARVDTAPSDGRVIVARMRIGRAQGLRLIGNVADRNGVDPILARALSDAPLEAPAGFLVREGTTGGGTLVIPWARAITTSAGADVDATARELVAARGGLEIRDKCGCLIFRANGSHRIGREGVDVWVALDFVADR